MTKQKLCAISARWAILIVVLVVPAASASAVPLDASAVAERVDALLAEETGSKPVDPTDDETFLRRIYLDIVGELPTPAEISRFALDPAADKRAKIVEHLLADPRYGENWGRYWRDVILYRRTDERALFASESAARYLTEQFNQGASWQKIARELITAEGSIGEDGRTVLLAAQWGQTPETAAEVCRVLMGVQIQCAQCHDHKTDRWKREQFHELAAFFPRVTIRPIREDGKRLGFELTGRDAQASPERKKKLKQKVVKRLEHYMPDIDDPAAEGTLMQPVFFQNKRQLPPGTTDEERRETLARWMTDKDNPWFAKALVNRVWAEMIGEGLYEPIDDLGPDKTCAAPKTMSLLANQFLAHDYDLKWLVKSIAATKVYASESRPRRNANQKPYEATCPQPLRADQLFNTLASALGVEEREPVPAVDRPLGKAAARLRSPRAQFGATFGFDPSLPRDELSGSIDQALLLMNGPAINRAITARGDADSTMLARLLDEIKDDDALVTELYLRTLAREPKERERKTCQEYLTEAPNRREAFEDLLWALVNSTEFLYRD